MNELIKELAEQAGLEYNFDPMFWLKYEKFANLVAAAEREACAKVCEDGGRDATGRIHVQAWGAAKAIRARGESK